MLLKLYEKNNNPQDLQQVVDILNLSHRHHVCHRLSRVKRTCH